MMPSPCLDQRDVTQTQECSVEHEISIVIPAFNEAESIGIVLSELTNATPANVSEIIVVDDGSSDETASIAREYPVRVLQHAINRGYGAALKTAISSAKGNYVLCMDADGQHRVEDVIKLCEIVSGGGNPESVIGNRIALLHSPMWRMPGKWFLRFLAEFLTQRKILDLNSGLRLVRRDIASRYLHLCPQGFSFSTTITMVLLARGFKVDYVPIEVKKRRGSTTVNLQTGFQAILLVLRLSALFNPLRIFLPASLMCVAAGIAWGARYVLDGQGVTVASMLAVLTGVLLFALGLICDQVAQLRLEQME